MVDGLDAMNALESIMIAGRADNRADRQINEGGKWCTGWIDYAGDGSMVDVMSK